MIAATQQHRDDPPAHDFRGVHSIASGARMDSGPALTPDRSRCGIEVAQLDPGGWDVQWQLEGSSVRSPNTIESTFHSRHYANNQWHPFRAGRRVCRAKNARLAVEFK